METASYTGVIYGGPFVRMAGNTLRQHAWMRGLDCHLEKEGIINQMVRWTVRGKKEVVEQFVRDVSHWIDNMQ